MSEIKYTDKPYAMGERPKALQNISGEDIKNLDHMQALMLQDFGTGVAAKFSRYDRLLNNAIASIQESKVAPNPFQTVGAMTIGGLTGVLVGGISGFLVEKSHLLPEEYSKRFTEIAVTAFLVAGAEAAKELIAPKHVNTISEKTAILMEQANRQKVEAYLSALAYERELEKIKNSLPQNNISSTETHEKMIEQQIANLVGVK